MAALSPSSICGSLLEVSSAAAGQRLVGERDQKAVRVCRRRGTAKRARHLKLRGLGVQRTERDESSGGGTADTGPAMDQEGCLAVPSDSEFDEVRHVVLARQ